MVYIFKIINTRYDSIKHIVKWHLVIIQRSVQTKKSCQQRPYRCALRQAVQACREPLPVVVLADVRGNDWWAVWIVCVPPRPRGPPSARNNCNVEEEQLENEICWLN